MFGPDPAGAHGNGNLAQFAHRGFDYGYWRMAWEAAGWKNAGDPLGEIRSKLRLIRGQLQSLLANGSGEMLHHYEAMLNCSDLVPVNAALGIEIAKTGHAVEAIGYLTKAVDGNPFDGTAAQALFRSLGQLGDTRAQRSLACDRRLLRQAMPNAYASEAWFEDAPPPDDDLVSIIILCCNQLDVTKLCVESILAQTRRSFELIFVNNGSTDDTQHYLESVRKRPAPDRVVIVENQTNCGYPIGCNQGLARARGRFLVFLNNDTVVPSRWLEGLLRPMLAGWPEVGIVGPVTNYAPEPQGLPISYSELDGLESFAATAAQGIRRANSADSANNRFLPADAARCVGQDWYVRRTVRDQLFRRRPLPARSRSWLSANCGTRHVHPSFWEPNLPKSGNRHKPSSPRKLRAFPRKMGRRALGKLPAGQTEPIGAERASRFRTAHLVSCCRRADIETG